MSIRHRMVKNKKKRVVAKTPNKRSSDTGITGLDLPRFSNDILSHRNSLNLSQREVARKAGISSAAVVFTENGRSSPLAQNFAKLCQFFKLNPNDYIKVA